MSAIAFDLRQPAVLAHELGAANRRLALQPETPRTIIALVQDVCDAIAAGHDAEVAAVNPWLWIRVQSAALRAQAALREEDPERRRRLRLALEQMRFLFSRIADRQPIGEDQPADDVVRWLDRALASVSQPRKAELVGVSPRTYQRWISDREPGSPTGDEERRVRVMARIVNQLRHSLTAPGVVDWFEHARADLDGLSPRSVLDDPERLELLLAAAAASRGNVAA